MCYSNPAKSLEIARARTTPEQWQQFEREFSVFCDIHGLPDKWAYWPTYDWAKWAFFKGRTRSMVLDNQQRIRVARFERIGLAMMDDEQAQQSLERWKEGK